MYYYIIVYNFVKTVTTRTVLKVVYKKYFNTVGLEILKENNIWSSNVKHVGTFKT